MKKAELVVEKAVKEVFEGSSSSDSVSLTSSDDEPMFPEEPEKLTKLPSFEKDIKLQRGKSPLALFTYYYKKMFKPIL